MPEFSGCCSCLDMVGSVRHTLWRMASSKSLADAEQDPGDARMFVRAKALAKVDEALLSTGVLHLITEGVWYSLRGIPLGFVTLECACFSRRRAFVWDAQEQEGQEAQERPVSYGGYV